MVSNCCILIRNVDLELLIPFSINALKDNVHFYLNDRILNKRPDALNPDIMKATGIWIFIQDKELQT
jgi:hypothetical protein